MKRLAAVVLLLLISTGCAGKGGGSRGAVIQRFTDDTAQHDHGDLTRPIGQR